MPRASGKLDLDKTIVIEVCENCSSHQWNTRHDANKYASQAHQSNYLHKFLLLTFLFSG
jgi:hypothetical protein